MSSLSVEGLPLQDAIRAAREQGYSEIDIIITQSPKDSSPIDESLLRVVKVSSDAGAKTLVFTAALNLLERGFVLEETGTTPS